MVKRIATTLRPPALDHLGLAEAVRWEAAAFGARSGLRCHVVANKRPPSLTAEQQTELFRIFQEALTNVARHAEASAVRVRLLDRRDQFELRVQDNGRGITPSQVADAASVGLLGMRERAMQVGAEIDISGATGKGTIVTVRVRRRLPGARSSAVARPARNRSWR